MDDIQKGILFPIKLPNWPQGGSMIQRLFYLLDDPEQSTFGTYDRPTQRNALSARVECARAQLYGGRTCCKSYARVGTWG